MVRLALLLKFGFLGVFAAAAIASVEELNLSWALVSLLVNCILFGWHAHGWGSSYVGGLVPPDENSSRAYIHFFDSSHLLFPHSSKRNQLVSGSDEEK